MRSAGAGGRPRARMPGPTSRRCSADWSLAAFGADGAGHDGVDTAPEHILGRLAGNGAPFTVTNGGLEPTIVGDLHHVVVRLVRPLGKPVRFLSRTGLCPGGGPLGPCA